MVNRKKVAIIGLGVSGIVAVKAFSERGHQVTAFERSHDLGGVWEPSRSYLGIHTQSSKDLYRFTAFPMPSHYPEFANGKQVHDYLHSYAKAFSLKDMFRFHASVKSMTRRADGKRGWTLTVDVDGEQVIQHFDFVAICTGMFSDKKRVTHPGQEAFINKGGVIVHSSEYNHNSMVNGKRVVVLGGSKSASDIVVGATENGAEHVTWVYRKLVWRVPPFINGMNLKYMLYMRAQEEQFNVWGRNVFQRIVFALCKPLIWLNFRGLQTMITWQLDLKKWNMIPDEPIENIIHCMLPLVTPGLFETFESGKASPIHAEMVRYEDDQVVLTNGEKIGCDLLIQAVGWKQQLLFLENKYVEKLVDADGQYKLCRYAVNPDVPDMGFVGLNSSFCNPLSSDLIAHWLVRYMDGQLVCDLSDGKMREEIDTVLNWRRNERPAAMSYGGCCIAPFHYQHFDTLIADMGATKQWCANPLEEYFSYPHADTYAKFMDSAPQYMAEENE